jgi:hypothetical protein
MVRRSSSRRRRIKLGTANEQKFFGSFFKKEQNLFLKIVAKSLTSLVLPVGAISLAHIISRDLSGTSWTLSRLVQ